MPQKQFCFYPIFLISTFILTIIFIPRKKYKTYFIYGLLIGGLGDVIVVSIMSNLLNIMWFENQDIFYVLGHHALSPLSWTVSVMIFLYFLPNRKWFLYPYIIFWAFNSLGYGYVVHNLKLFFFQNWLYPFAAFFIFLFWWSFAVWLFIKTNDLGYKIK